MRLLFSTHNTITKIILNASLISFPNAALENHLPDHLSKFWYSATALENSKVSFSIPTGGIFGEVGVNTFRNAIGMGKRCQQKERSERISFLLGGGGHHSQAKKKQREKVVLHSILSPLLKMHKMKEGYGNDEVPQYLTQVFSVNN
ncbi:hypothetical protein Tco_1098808 [Tanacetum coccineum]